jgi:hypothetical protein
MGQVIRFVPRSERERARLIREAGAIYDSIVPQSDPVREQREPAFARRHRLTDRRRLTLLRKRLPAQACPVIARANNSKLPTTTTALD